MGVDALVDRVTGHARRLESLWFSHGMVELAVTVDILPFMAVGTGHTSGHVSVKGAPLFAKTEGFSRSAVAWQTRFTLFDFGVGVRVSIPFLLGVAWVA